MKRKVTLSLDSKLYRDYQKHCEENAVMLSRRVEILLKKDLEDANKNG